MNISIGLCYKRVTVPGTFPSQQSNSVTVRFDGFDSINLRIELDNRNEKIGYKIREHSNAKVPLMAIIGKEEMSAGTVSIRNLRENETNTYTIDEAAKLLAQESCLPG